MVEPRGICAVSKSTMENGSGQCGFEFHGHESWLASSIPFVAFFIVRGAGKRKDADFAGRAHFPPTLQGELLLTTLTGCSCWTRCDKWPYEGIADTFVRLFQFLAADLIANVRSHGKIRCPLWGMDSRSGGK